MSKYYCYHNKMPELRYYQDECLDVMFGHTEKFSVYNLFCGTGKTRIYTQYLADYKNLTNEICIILFPRIALVEQYYNDYYHNNIYSKEFTKEFACKRFSSEHTSKSDLSELKRFCALKKPKLLLTTHTSFKEIYKSLLSLQPKVTISNIIIDEVHHKSSKKDIEFFSNIEAKYVLGFTATVANLLQPYVRYEYRFCDALRDGFCKNFEIVPYVTSDSKNPENLYKGLVYLAEKTSIKNILCFHAFSNIAGKNGKTSVSEYENLSPRLSDSAGVSFSRINSHSITAKTPNKSRFKILQDVSCAGDDELNIVHSCNTISEGIDTKSINAICFVDAKGSLISITQSIGRITRLDPDNDDLSKVFIVFFDVDDDEDCLETIVEESSYGTIVCVLSFIKQDNPELFDAALRNPSILTRTEYDFHFSKVIVNKNGGDMYIGKNLEEIHEDNVIVCTTDKDGEIFTLDEFLSNRTVRKESNVDDWIYLYVDSETNNVLDTLGSGRRATTTKKPKKVVSFVNPDDAIIIRDLLEPTAKKTRLQQLSELLDSIRSKKTVPSSGLFTTLKGIKRGEMAGPAITAEEDKKLSTFFKTTEWWNVTDSLFQKQRERVYDDSVKTITYTKSRFLKIQELANYIIDNEKIPDTSIELGKFFVKLKNIKNGSTIDTVKPLTEKEIDYLSEFFKAEDWELITGKNFNQHLEDFFDQAVLSVQYTSAPTTATATAALSVVHTENRHARNSMNIILAYLNTGNRKGLDKLKVLQSCKKGTRKEGKLYVSVSKMLEELHNEWHLVPPENLRKIFNEDSDFYKKYPYDDTIFLGTTLASETQSLHSFTSRSGMSVRGSGVKRSDPLPIIPERGPADIIFDFSDVLDDPDEEFTKDLKKEIRGLYKTRNVSFLQFLERRGLVGEDLLEMLV